MRIDRKMLCLAACVIVTSGSSGNVVERIAADGSLSNRQLFARMTDLLPGPAQPSIWLGPDGMKLGSDGNIFVAHYMGGQVVKMSSDGEFLQSFEIPGIAVTNLTFYPDDNSMYVAAVEDLTGAPYHGSIWKIDVIGE